MPRPPQKITMLPAVGKPDIAAAVSLLLPLLDSFLRAVPLTSQRLQQSAHGRHDPAGPSKRKNR